jgi:hypothetical protein
MNEQMRFVVELLYGKGAHADPSRWSEMSPLSLALVPCLDSRTQSGRLSGIWTTGWITNSGGS